jgi:hypothetical protein
MPAARIMPGEEGDPRQDTGRPAPAVTALLILVGLGLWAGVVRACLLLLVQRGICRELAVALPEPARWLFGLSWWDWFGSYWWVVVLGLFALAPAAAWMTYWTRHRHPEGCDVLDGVLALRSVRKPGDSCERQRPARSQKCWMPGLAPSW